MLNLCIVAIFKNECEILKEWLDHYINQGVNKFFLIDNNSNDDYKTILQFYPHDLIEVIFDERKYCQYHLYNIHFLNKSKEYKWILVCDLDEFVYARNGFKTITDYLLTIPEEFTQIKIPWKIFGSNGFNTLDKKQPKSVIQSFTKRTNYDNLNLDGGHNFCKKLNEINCSEVKSIVKSEFLDKLLIHEHKCTENNLYNHLNVYEEINFMEINEKILNSNFLHLNHYVIQSLEWFLRIKSKRGSNFSKEQEYLRNEEYFFKYDKHSNEIEDEELKNIIY